MIQVMIRLCFVLLVVNQLVIPCLAYRSYNSREGSRYHRDYKDPAKMNTLAGTATKILTQGTYRKGLGISAWGIVILIVAIILAIMGLYYFSICYPILCHTNTKYNRMSLPTLA